MTKKFSKIRKWAKEKNVRIEETQNCKKIKVVYDNGATFFIEEKESNVRLVINRGKGLKRVGDSKGLYIRKSTDVYSTKERSQVECIKKLESYME